MVSLLPQPEPPDPVEGALGHFDHTNWVKAALKALDAGALHKSGDTVTSALVVNNANAEQADIILVGAAARSVWGYLADKPRWRAVFGDTSVETGADAGANFLLMAYGDDGVTSKTVLSINRKTGLATVLGSPTSAKGIATKEYADMVIPVGGIILWPGASVPAGWLLCNGQSTTGYPLLQAIVGANVPDMRSRVPVGAGQGAGLTNYALGAAGGAESVTLTEAQIPVKAHTHAIDHDHPAVTSGPGTNHSHTINHDHAAVATSSDTHSHTLSIREGTGTGDGYYLDTNPTDSGTQKTLAASKTSDDTHNHTADLPAYTGSSGGEAAHTHSVDVPALVGVSGPASAGAAATPHDIRMPYRAVGYIIRAA